MSWSEREEKLLASLKMELESIRGRKERVVGQDAYTYIWEKEKRIEKEIDELVRQRQLAEETVKPTPIPKVSIEEIRRGFLEEEREKEPEKKVLEKLLEGS